MDPNYLIGLNVLNRLIEIGLSDLNCDEIKLSAYNVNLDFMLSLFKKHENLKKIAIFSNTENITHSGKNSDSIYDLFKKSKLHIYHLSQNKYIIHSKIYSFYKDNKCELVGIGSPNFTRNSNQNIEYVLYFMDPIPQMFNDTWSFFEHETDEYHFNINQIENIIYRDLTEQEINIEPELLENLWEHQKAIIKWASNKKRAIINIPPGTGKTRIGLTYLKHIRNQERNLTTIVLVPTRHLIKQWISILKENNVDAIEGGTNIADYESYIAEPEEKIVVTLYSRFFEHQNYLSSKLSIINPPCLILADECHNIYNYLDKLDEFTLNYEDCNYYHIGLSATIDNYNLNERNRYVNYCGGNLTVFDVTLQSFYSNWNHRNNSPILKNIEYLPYFYYLNQEEMNRYNELTKSIFAQMNQQNLHGSNDGSAAIKRAHFVRQLKGGIEKLKFALNDHLSLFNDNNTIIFVHTNLIAQEVRNFIVSQDGWDIENSAYIYDSQQDETYLEYAMSKFKEQKGFCLLSERMLAEGFDLPKISTLALHASHRSERDWIQKIGRAIRYDPENSNAVAKIIDIVFCSDKGDILSIDRERFNILKALSI